MDDVTNNGTIDPTNNTVIEPVEPQTPAIDDGVPMTPEGTVDVDKILETNKKLFERAKTAEAAVKAFKGSGMPAPKVVSTPSASPLDPVEAALLVNGMSEELLGELKKVAQVRGTSLLKAQSDPIFVAVKANLEKEKKTQDASLGASRSSGAVKPKKDLSSPGLTREEHMAMIKNLNS